MHGMTPDEWRSLVGGRVERQRKEQGVSVEAAAKFAGFSRTWWRQLESGRRIEADGTVTTVNPRPESLAAASRAIGWTPDSIERLKRGLEPIDAHPSHDNGQGGDSDQPAMLAEILRLLRAHRDSDVAPSTRLMDVATRDEIRSELAARTDDLLEALSELTQAVQAQEHRLRELEAHVSAPANIEPPPRKHTRVTRT